MKFNILTTLLLAIGFIFFAVRYGGGPWPPLRIAGAVLIVISLLGVIAARVQLGGAFSVRAKATRLVTTGLYSRVRNPIYCFGMLLFVGMALFTRTWAILLVLLVLIPMQVKRARREAAVLEAEFGDDYRRYRAQTWF